MIENIINLSPEAVRSISELRLEPTYQRWHDELLAILAGNRYEAIENVGSPRQYILRLFADSSSRTRSTQTFLVALNEIVNGWLPELNDSSLNGALLSLIAAFRPLNGVERILNHLLPGDSLSFTCGSDPVSVRISKAALFALDSYWTLPPADRQRPAFILYTGLLRKHLERSSDELVPHCFRRLLELRSLDLENRSDRSLASRVIGFDGVLTEIIQYATGIHRGLLEDQIGSVLALCLEFRDDSVEEQPYLRYAHFVDILRRLGAGLVDFPHNQLIAIQLNDQTRISIRLPERSRVDYKHASSYEEDVEFRREYKSFHVAH